MNTHTPIERLKVWMGVLLIGGFLFASGEASFDLTPRQKDIRFLKGKLEQFQLRSNRSIEGKKALARLESELARLGQCLDQMTDLVREIESLDSRLYTLKIIELDPKHSEVERLKQSFEQRLLQIAEEMMHSKRAIDRHNSNRPVMAPDGSNAETCQRFNAEALELNTRHAKLNAAFLSLQGEKEREVARTILVYAKAQREFAAVQTSRDRLAQRLGELAQTYADMRPSLVDGFVGMEIKVPLTPFSQAIPGSNRPRTIPPPVGPGSNARAIDQLLVVTSSSRSAAGRDEADQAESLPTLLEARLRSSYEFDDGGGMLPAKLPEVALPQGRPLGKQRIVPLVLPPSPSERMVVPSEIRNSPKLKAIEARQQDRFKRLKKDYEDRKSLLKEGLNAKPEELSRNLKSIASNQGGAAWDQFAKEAILRGSKDADLEFQPKPQRKVVVPPPPKEPQP